MARRLPGQSRQWVQTNESDLFSLQTKNINFDEEGYIKLSPRAVSLVDEDTTNFGLPTALGRRSDGNFEVVTTSTPFEIQIDANAASGVSAVEDTDSDGDSPPNFNFNSHGCWFNNLWNVTEDDELYTKNLSNGNWTDRNKSANMTAGVLHPVAHMISRDTLMVGNGNQVLQYDTSYSADTTLNLPSLFEVTKLAYNGGKMAIATKLSDTVQGINGQAQFFLWDGTSAATNPGIDSGADYILDVIAYKGTFVIVNRAGQLRMYNGGGWTELAQLPVWFTSRTWGDSVNQQGVGDILEADGDIIYINIDGSTEQYGRKGEEYLSPGGLWCFDPKVGLYHRMAPSISTASRLTVTASNVNTSTDVFTKTAGTIPPNGSPVKYVESPGNQIGGLLIGKVYYCIKLSSTTFQLATTRENALNNIPVDITAQSSSTSYFLGVNLLDYGQSYVLRTGAVASNDTTDLVRNQFVFAAEIQDHDSSSNLFHLCFDVDGLNNIGYIVTPKLIAQNVTNNTQNIYIRHRRLKEGEWIKIKSQTKEITGLPVTTPQHQNHCTWSGANEFYVTGDFSEAKTYLDNGGELECEIIAGNGAGQMSQIESITCENGICSVVLEDEIEGVTSGNSCDVSIDAWDEKKTITETDVEVSQIHVGEQSGWIKFKIIMYGTDVTIYEIPIAESFKKPVS